MNSAAAQLHYPLGDTLPEAGKSLEVAPGVRWLRMGLPFALNHINLWLVRDCIDGRDGWTVVDTCVDRPESRAQWESVLAGELGGLPVLRVVVTHMHPDHVGLAHWLCARFAAPLWMSATDYYVARTACEAGVSAAPANTANAAAADHFAANGLTSEAGLDQMRSRRDYYPSLVPALPASYHRLMDGLSFLMGPHMWRCISGYGHAPEHIALYCEALNVLISGDMLLPRISTNVSVYETEPEGNPLPLFLQGIDRFLELPANCLVLPSHGKPFTGAHTRVDELRAHHADRLQEVLDACAQKPCSAFDVVPVLFKRELDSHQMSFAMGEAVAHLHALWHDGQLRRSKHADGVWRFQP